MYKRQIPTILSRCQIFDFNRIQIEDIANHLAYIAGNENITAEKDALHIIAQKADGALRDACSIFDQIVSFAGNNVTYKAVIDNLNILDYDYYFKVTDAILSENISSALLTFNDILNNGFDGHNFVAGMGDHFRNLLVGKDPETLQLLEVGTNIREKYKEQSGKCSLPILVKGLTILNKTDINYKSSKNQRLQVELALMQLCSLSSIGIEAEKKNDILLRSKTSSPQIPNKPAASAAIEKPKGEAIQSSVPIQKAAPVVETATIVKKPLIKTATPSINQHLNNEKKTDKTVETLEQINAQPKSNFTQQQLETVWEKYANSIKEKGKTNLATNLLNKKPLLKDNFNIEFIITNKSVEESINEDKLVFLGILRKELNNYSIQLQLVINAIEDKTNLYTATDRYKRLVEKNPTLNTFRQKFDLDLEF